MNKPKPRNKFEADIFKQLTKAKVNFKYESEKIPYIFSGHYNPDFVIKAPNGKIYVETKGFLRDADKRKMRAVKATNPSLDIRLLFHEKCKKSDIKWAIKNRFPYAIGNIPKDWLDGF